MTMGTKYVVQYRVRTRGGTARWKDAKMYDTLEVAEGVKAEAIKYEMKGTKDWRVRPVM